jgi:thiamine-phosphate pyrophosphorylase
MPSERPALRGLYAITPETPDTEVLVAKVDACLAGGAALVQYRAKDLGPDAALDQARAIAALCRRWGALFIVNDSIDLAEAAGAHGVHLGRDDASVRQARARLPRAVIGASCYADPELARDARAAGADYVAIGSVFPSSTKPGAQRAPLHAIATAKHAGGLPVAAIGGIDSANAALAVAAGADMVAAISAVFDAADVRSAAAAISLLFATTSGSNQHVRAQPRAV